MGCSSVRRPPPGAATTTGTTTTTATGTTTTTTTAAAAAAATTAIVATAAAAAVTRVATCANTSDHRVQMGGLGGGGHDVGRTDGFGPKVVRAVSDVVLKPLDGGSGIPVIARRRRE
jgi:hypothetical protein